MGKLILTGDMSGRSIVNWALAISVASAVVFIVNQQSAIAKVRAENDDLAKANEEAAQLEAENGQIGALRNENAEVKRLREANVDLPGLRNQVMQLRRQVEAMEKLKAENAALAAQQKSPGAGTNLEDRGERRKQMMGSVFRREDLADVGTGFPRATLQTFMWAMSNGNIQRMRDCLTLEAAAGLANVPDDSLRQEASRMAEGFTGYEIVGRKDSPDEIDLEIKLSATGQTQEMRFKNLGTDWKLMR
jgi:hypothetical protein